MKSTPKYTLSPRKRAVLLAIADLLEEDPLWPPSFQQVGERSGLGEVRVSYWIYLLMKDGLVTREAKAKHDLALTAEGRKAVRWLRKKGQ